MPPSVRRPLPIKAVMALQDRTVAEFAPQVPCSTAWLHRIVNGREQPSQQFADRCSELLGVPSCDLFDEDLDFVDWLRRSREASGVPETLEDEATIAQVARILGGAA